MAPMKGKAITVATTSEVSVRVDELANRLRTSRAGICIIALEYVLPMIEAGEMAVVNGKLAVVKGEAA